MGGAPRMYPTVTFLLVVAAFLVGLYFGNGGLFRAGAVPFIEEDISQPVGVDFTPLWKAWHILDDKFVPASTTAPLRDEEKLWGAIQGLAGSYGDPYTAFLPPEDSEIFESDIRGNFGGVGMEIADRAGAIVVVAPLKGTPAERAGIRAGDAIVAIDGTTTSGMSVNDAVKLIRGEVGSTVTLTISREGEPNTIEIPVVRDIIQIPTISTELRGDGVFVIELYNFNAQAGSLFRSALREFIESGSDKLILDLRGNPGGFLEVAVDVASWFLPTGKVIVSEHFGEGENDRKHRSRGYDIFNENLKMVILVDRGSASASEIVTGALQEYDIATVVGTRTFGKGSVQELVNINGTASLKVTVARWLTPEGRTISDGGIEPDISVEMTEEDVQEERDPQLTRAVEFLLGI